MDQFTEVSEKGFGDNLMDSIKGVVSGLLLFMISFPVLWWNEGRVDLSQVAKKAKAVGTASVDPSGEGKLVSVTGELAGDEKIGDPDYLVPGKYIRLERVVEMYAWKEHESSETKKKLGGGSTTKTTYTYDTEWTQHPSTSSSFKVPEGHENPALNVHGDHFSVAKAGIGAYHFDPNEAEMPSGSPLKLTPDKVKGLDGAAKAGEAPAGEDDKADQGDKADPGDKADKADQGDKAAADDQADEAPVKAKVKAKKGKRHHGRSRHRGPAASAPAPAKGASAAPGRRPQPERRRATAWELADDTYLFRGRGSLDKPRVGDVRISFLVVEPGVKVTLFGEQHGSEIKAYHYKGDTTLFRALGGDREEAISTLATEHKLITWILRIVGFLLMWFGLALFFGPINAVLDVIPFLGSAGRFLVGLVMFPIALMLSLFTIIISIIAHSPILLVLTLVGLGAGGYFLYQKRKAQKAGA